MIQEKTLFVTAVNCCLKRSTRFFIEATMAKAKGNGSITEVMRRWGTVNLFYPPDGQAREFSVMRK
jgi:hypothetical protein